MNDLITVIVAIYNVDKYLDECIHSIISQKYDNLEIILVDDGSIDMSSQICDNYALKDKRINVIHKQNGGLSSARNIGLNIAKGKYIAFVDGDDVLNVNMYKKLHNAILLTKAQIAECYSLPFFDGSTPWQGIDNNKKNKPEVRNSDQWHLQTSLGDFISCAAWNKLYVTELFENIIYPEGRYYEDEATTFRLVERASLICRIPDRLYYYRQRPGSIVQSNMSKKKIQDRMAAFDDKIVYFQGSRNKQVESFVRSRACLSLMSDIKRIDNTNGGHDLQYILKKKLKDNFSKIKFSPFVPLKYKLAIWWFMTTHKGLIFK